MNGRIKLFALFSTLATTALEPVEQLNNLKIQNDENNLERQSSLTYESIIKEKMSIVVGDGNFSKSNLLNDVDSIKGEISNVLVMLKKYYLGYEYDFTLTKEVFVGAKKISSFFNKEEKLTHNLKVSVDAIFNDLLIELKTDLLMSKEDEYNSLIEYLTSLYVKEGENLVPKGDLERYMNWSILQLQHKIGPIAKAYHDNYYGYASEDDLNKLSTWFGVGNNEVLSFDELKINMFNYALSNNNASTIRELIEQFSIELGDINESLNENTILGRELISVIKDVEIVNQMWRNNYYGVKNYSGKWFNLTYDNEINNWKSPTNRNDIEEIKKLIIDNSQTLKETLQSYKSEPQNLIDFENYQLDEMSKLLQPIIEFYNEWYMGYQISPSNELDKLDQNLKIWEYDDVFNKISSSVFKNKSTTSWEFDYIERSYYSAFKQNSFRDEQMNALIIDINDHLIGDLFKNNYFGYNFASSVPSNIQEFFDWQNSDKLDATWDLTNWVDNDWANKNSSTYKIFASLNNDHFNNLKIGKTFKSTIEEYLLVESNSLVQQFINFQLQSLSMDVSKLISKYQDAYLGYSSPMVINSTYLPGLVKTSNGNYNWNLDSAVNTLKLSGGYYQDDNRLNNGRWLYNNALVQIGEKLTSEIDNFGLKESTAFDNDILKIISEYKSIFRGFLHDVNGNKLIYKTLGGDDALINGVFVSEALDVASSVFDRNALRKFINEFHSVGISNTIWESNVIKNYRDNINLFKDEQTKIFRNFLQLLSKEYHKLSKGYVATLGGASLNFPSLPFFAVNKEELIFDVNKAINFFDHKTYNQVKTPDSTIEYRISCDIYEKFSNNLINYEKEQNQLRDQNLGINEDVFTRQTEIFDYLSKKEVDKSWSTHPNYRQKYSDSILSKIALGNFFSQFNKNLDELNDIGTNWYSSTDGGDGASWEDTNLNHSFSFFTQYGLSFQLFYDSNNPTKMSASILDIDTGEYLLKGVIDDILFTPNSQDIDITYGPTLIITKDKKQFIYKVIPSIDNSQFQQLLFTIADVSTGVPKYTKTQKMTIIKNTESDNSVASSVSVVEYNNEKFDYANLSPDFTKKLEKNTEIENVIERALIYNITTKFINDSVIKIIVAHDQKNQIKIHDKINISNSRFVIKNYSSEELISKLPNNPTPKPSEAIINNSFPVWAIPLIIILALTIIGLPIIYFLIKKLRKNKIIKNKKTSKKSSNKI